MYRLWFLSLLLLPLTCTGPAWASPPSGWPVHFLVERARETTSPDLVGRNWLSWSETTQRWEGIVSGKQTYLGVCIDGLQVGLWDEDTNDGELGTPDGAGPQNVFAKGYGSDGATLYVIDSDWGWLSTPEGFFEAWCYGAGCAIAWCLLLAVCPRLVIDGSLLMPRSG